MHNWIQLYLEEKKGLLDYRGYINPKRRPGSNGYDLPDEDQQLITIQFEWHECLKAVSSSFIGTSPEFEIALYTLCFYGGPPNDITDIVELGPYVAEITSYKYTHRGITYVGSTFPSAIIE